MIGDYCIHLKYVVNKMAILGENIYQEVIINKFLRTLIEKFDSMILIIEEKKDLSKMDLDSLIDTLTSHEESVAKRKQDRSRGSVFTKEQIFSTKGDEGSRQGHVGHGSRGRGHNGRVDQGRSHDGDFEESHTTRGGYNVCGRERGDHDMRNV